MFIILIEGIVNMKKYKTFKKQEDSFNKVSNWILITMLIVLGYFITIIGGRCFISIQDSSILHRSEEESDITNSTLLIKI